MRIFHRWCWPASEIGFKLDVSARSSLGMIDKSEFQIWAANAATVAAPMARAHAQSNLCD